LKEFLCGSFGKIVKIGGTMKKYVCDACGYIYDPMTNDNVAFEDLPEDWVCPECGVGKDLFSPLD